MTISEYTYNNSTHFSSGKGFLTLFALQFLFVVGTIYADVKLGLVTLSFTLLIAIIILIRRSNDEYTDWSRCKNGMLYLYLIWGIFCLVEIANPNSVQAAWNMAIPHHLIYPLILAIIVPLSIRNIKGINILLIIWSIFILIASLKGYWQKSYGFSQRDFYFLYELGGYKTHVIWSGIRYFSCLGNAANYGVHSAMAIVVFGISLFYIKNLWLKIYFAFIVILAIYGMGISGTRAALAVPISGLGLFVILSRNWKGVLFSVLALMTLFIFFRFTNIGEGNEYIRKMRSAFNPTEDASYQARVYNREQMKELLKTKPIGYGLGLAKGERFQPKEVMPYPPDSWLVNVWIETGIIGLVIYLLVHGVLFAWCSWILMFKIMNKQLRGLLAAWLCMSAGFFAAAYANDVMQYPSIIVIYTAFALCFSGPHIDKDIKEEADKKNK
ncbi:hypothetical protein HMPREF1214_02603 [Bacteroides sp. HPS0048]|jgi:transmembrane protein|uniref:O-antigen ligase family protein n=1 Tax=Bacteroides sp. HPS0048 TaxID=1078089 RepID=UPI00037F7C34|nr:O-antigen ligase family protein [Bacteroides sp. HPS0048]EOA57092.1 hypothetical protein HMPREF1214_02603 [Bacteroides sp. HPS0048]